MKSITVRLDDELKAQAEAALARLEISPTQAITHLYLYLAQHGQLPFRVRLLAESPEEVFRATLAHVRSVTELMTSVAGLPADADSRAGMTKLCQARCLQLRQRITDNAAFMAGTACRDPQTHLPDENVAQYWRWIQDHLIQAENALGQAAPDMPATLNAIAGKLTGYYWQLATWIDFQEAGCQASQI
ncbi:type II toxin-antitoxin system RelB/DinJ family antitoxin [Pantoea vagans]|uniref:type II toxin-antitoxin system RelB/DinJ family antitoxin n=1 Tax=Pantoea vagans TaxID=470934 RepID=UPI00065F7F1C|nr:type II toxin-antitoxin system RelB/DinJ family antitoxin [Pantoea vagans]